MSTAFNWLLLLALLAGGPAQAAGTRPADRATGQPTTTLPQQAARQAARRAAVVAPPAWQPAAASPAPAQPPGPALVLLAGIVRRPDGQPCPGVCVFPTTNARQLAVTDADGIFYLPVLAHTPLHIQADYFGVGSSQIAISGVAPQPVSIVLGR